MMDIPELSFASDRRRVLSAVGAMAGLAAAGAARAQGAGGAGTAKPLHGKAAIVTAARNNQGRAYAIAMARLGADVALHFHRAESKDQNDETVRWVREQGVRVATVIGDMAEASVAKAVFDAAQNTFGKVDIVVNTVGCIVKKPFVQLTEADYVKSERANVKALFHVFQQGAQRLADNGRLIHIGASLTAGTAPGYALYAGTKAPCEEFTRMVTREVGKRGITVNTIAPGPLGNTFFHAAETPESARFAANLSVVGRLGKESDITPLVTFLALPESQWVTGQTLWVNGGYLTR